MLLHQEKDKAAINTPLPNAIMEAQDCLGNRQTLQGQNRSIMEYLQQIPRIVNQLLNRKPHLRFINIADKDYNKN